MELTIRGDKRDLVVVVLQETFVSCDIVEEVHFDSRCKSIVHNNHRDSQAPYLHPSRQGQAHECQDPTGHEVFAKFRKHVKSEFGLRGNSQDAIDDADGGEADGDIRSRINEIRMKDGRQTNQHLHQILLIVFAKEPQCVCSFSEAR